LADHAEALAWRPAEHHRDGIPVDPGMLPDVAPVDVGHAPADRRAVGEVEFVDRAVDRVVLDCRHHLEAGLLEPEAHAPRPREQIDADHSGSSHHLSYIIGETRRGRGELRSAAGSRIACPTNTIDTRPYLRKRALSPWPSAPVEPVARIQHISNLARESV